MKRAGHSSSQAVRPTTRRVFLGQLAGACGVAAAPWIVPSSALGSAGRPAPSERITVGLIGKGVMGSGHLHRLAGDPDIQVLAVCDVDRLRCEEGRQYVDATYAADRASGAYRGCAGYTHYRDLLARPDVDAVVIVTPDHWHAIQAVDSARAGKDVYCEKPISITVGQGRDVVAAVRRYGRVFQTGTQYRSIPTVRRVCEFVRQGGLGPVKSVFTLWNSLAGFMGAARFRPYDQFLDLGRTGPSYVPLAFPLPAEAAPEGLDWDLWVGPASWHPYNRLYHTNPPPGVVPWSFSEDFGAASVTWHHSHSADVIQYALGMENSGPIEFLHPRQGVFPTLTCRYASGTLMHLVDHWDMVKDAYHAVPSGARLAGNFGGVFVGERGWVTSMSTGGPVEAGPERLFEELKLKTRQVEIGDNDHHANWFNCIRTRARPSCDEEIGHRSASLGHLCIIAHRLERSLKWDPVKEEFIGDEQANRLCRRALRQPWQI